MDTWFYAWLRLKNAHEGRSPFLIDPAARNDVLEAFLAHVARGPRGRSTADKLAYLDRCLDSVDFVLASLDDPTDNTRCYFVGMRDTLQIVRSSLKKR